MRKNRKGEWEIESDEEFYEIQKQLIKKIFAKDGVRE